MKLLLQRVYENYAEGVTAGAGVVGAAPMPPIPLPPLIQFELCRNPRYRLLVDNSLTLRKVPLVPVRPVRVF